MRDHDPGPPDFPQFLSRVSRAVWQDRGLWGAISEHSHPQVIQRSPQSIAWGPEAMARAAIPLMLAFPDQHLLTEDVIWAGQPRIGMIGSQRTMVCASHLGQGVFGAPTGRQVRFRTIADSYAKDDRLCEEWRITDTAAILRQLDIEPCDWAKRQLTHLDPETGPFRPALDVVGPYTGQGNHSEWAKAYADVLLRVLQGELGVIADQYDPACQIAPPGGQDGFGHAAADAFWLGLRASFPSARFDIHHVMGMEDPLMPPRAALRWSLNGAHDGWGMFGEPSGAEVHVMGISHAEFGPEGIRREWAIVDVAAIHMQIAKATG